MRLIAALLAICLWSAPAGAADPLARARAAAERQDYARAERELRARLAAHPADEEARFLLARVLAWSGRHADALREYDRLIKARPRNSDYLLGAAHAHHWSGNPAAALPLLRTARRLAPRYEAIWRAQIEALLALGDDDRLRQARLIQDEARRRFPKSEWAYEPRPSPVAQQQVAPAPAPSPRPAPAAPPPSVAAVPPPAPVAAALPRVSRYPDNEVEIGFTRESLTKGLPSWSSLYVEGLHRYGERHTLYGALRRTSRFDLEDTEATVGLYYPLDAAWTLNVEGSASPDHNVLPRYTAYGQLHRNLGSGWGAAAGYRHTEYTASGVGIASVLLERYWAGWRAAYSLYSGRPEGASSAPSHRFQLEAHYGDRDRVGLSYTTGRESENVGPPRGLITSDVRELMLYGQHWLTRDWAVTYELLTHEQGDLYRRRGGRLGLRRAF
jgi:YaiO family outer membrane protein